MSNRPSSFKFAQIFPTGTIAMICGIGAIANLVQNLAIACLIGMVGISIGMATLRMRVERLDKTLAFMGIILSFIPIVYAVIDWVKE